MTPSDQREFDVVLLGATGFVGRLTAQHLAQAAGREVRIALAGRSGSRLTQVRAELGDAGRDWPLITVDVTDGPALAELARRTRVLLTTVGPYLRHGLPVVQACADAGTHYADLTGETLFVRRSIDASHHRAVETGARIVHACGFDSVPSDLSVGLLAEHAARDGQGTLAETVLHVRDMRGGVSGGTVDSLRVQTEEAGSDQQLRKLAASALALTDREAARPGRSRPAPRRRLPVGLDARTGRWSAPFVMGGFNRQIVLRTDQLGGWAYGPEFHYREVIDTGQGPVGVAAAAALLAGSTALFGAMSFSPTRRVLDRFLPDPGKGPSEKTRRNGRFRLEVTAATTTGARYRAEFAADLDPGYNGTAVMLGQSGLSLAFDADLAERAGVLTPMSAMGEALARRLRDQRFTVTTAPC